MSDRQHIEALELDHKPGSVDMNAEQTGKFPFHAFEFDNPEETAPDITLISPWSFIIEEDLSAGSLTVGSGTKITKITISTSDPSGGSDGDVWMKREA